MMFTTAFFQPRKVHHSGEEAYSTSLLGHFFDSKKCSEAASSPHLRPPPLKDNRLNKLLNAIVFPGSFTIFAGHLYYAK